MEEVNNFNKNTKKIGNLKETNQYTRNVRCNITLQDSNTSTAPSPKLLTTDILQKFKMILSSKF